MNTLQSHTEEYEDGIVTELGYSAISDAECYGAASSIGAGSNSISKIWLAFREGKTLSLYSKTKLVVHPKTEAELASWCEENFPDCYSECLRRLKH